MASIRNQVVKQSLYLFIQINVETLILFDSVDSTKRGISQAYYDRRAPPLNFGDNSQPTPMTHVCKDMIHNNNNFPLYFNN